MKLKLLFLMGILLVCSNTVKGQNQTSKAAVNVAPKFTVLPHGSIGLWCPGTPNANVLFEVTDDQTDARNLKVSVSYVSQNPYAIQSVLLTNVTYATWSVTTTPLTKLEGNVTFTVKVEDEQGLFATASYIINFDDAVNPIFTPVSNRNESLNSSCKFLIPDYTGLANFQDECPDLKVTQTPAVGTEVSGRDTTQLITLTADDGNGNRSITSFTITLKDVTPPVVVTKNIAVQLGSTGSVTVPPLNLVGSGTDACNGSIVYTLDKSTFTCADAGKTIDVLLKATDASSNFKIYPAKVTVEDKTAPVITCKDNIIVPNTTNQCFAYQTIINPTVIDNCTTNPTYTIVRSDSKPLLADSFNIGTTIITWTAADNFGNSATCYQTVTVKDTVKPLVKVVAPFSAYLDKNGKASITVSQIDNGTTDNCTIATRVISRDSFTCADAGQAIPVVLTVTDTSGNSSSNTVYVTVVDAIKPVIVFNDLVKSNDLYMCSWTPAPAEVPSVSATDNCTINKTPFGIRSDAQGLTAPYSIGVTTITWYVYDNASTPNAAVPIVQKVTVKDTQLPAFKPTPDFKDSVVVQFDPDNGCGYPASKLTKPSAVDNCTLSENLKITPSPALIPISAWPEHLPTIVTWTITDESGNSTTKTQMVTVEDNTSPFVKTKNITRFFDTNGQIVISPEDIEDLPTTDNCIKSQVVVPNIISCNFEGPNIVTLVATDTYGNRTEMNAVVTANDNTQPIALAKNITVQLNSSGSAVITASDVNNGSTDNCSIASYTWSKSSFNCANVGSNTITLIVTDTSGNTSKANATVIVEDKIAPTVITKNITVQLNAKGTVSIVPTDVLVSATDACGVNVLSLSKSTFTNVDALASPVTITVYATDINGNVGSAKATVTFTTLGVNTYKKEKEITIYPNPTTSVLHLQFSNEVIIDKIVVRDLSGKIVVQQTKETSEINVEKLASGIYTIEANSGKEKFKTKFIKK